MPVVDGSGTAVNNVPPMVLLWPFLLAAGLDLVLRWVIRAQGGGTTALGVLAWPVLGCLAVHAVGQLSYPGPQRPRRSAVLEVRRVRDFLPRGLAWTVAAIFAAAADSGHDGRRARCGGRKLRGPARSRRQRVRLDQHGRNRGAGGALAWPPLPGMQPTTWDAPWQPAVAAGAVLAAVGLVIAVVPVKGFARTPAAAATPLRAGAQ